MMTTTTATTTSTNLGTGGTRTMVGLGILVGHRPRRVPSAEGSIRDLYSSIRAPSCAAAGAPDISAFSEPFFSLHMSGSTKPGRGGHRSSEGNTAVGGKASHSVEGERPAKHMNACAAQTQAVEGELCFATRVSPPLPLLFQALVTLQPALFGHIRHHVFYPILPVILFFFLLLFHFLGFSSARVSTNDFIIDFFLNTHNINFSFF